MNKTLKLIAALSLAASLAGCSSDKAPADSGNNETETNTETSAVNPHGYQIVPLEAAQLPLSLPDLDAGVINGNYALENGLSVADDALATESADGDAIQQYVNIIAVKDGNQDEDKIKALTDVLHSDAIVKYINDTYQGAVVPYDGEQ